VFEGIRTGQLVLTDGVASLADKASPVYASQLATAVEEPVTLSPTLGLPDIEGRAYQDKLGPPIGEYIEALDAATATIDRKHAAVAGWLGNAIADVEFVGKNYEVALRRYERGAIYLLASGEVYEVHGAIYQKYLGLGAQNSYLGFPKTSEQDTIAGKGRVNYFDGGAIYWSPATGARALHGAIHDEWQRLGTDASYLKFPTTDVGYIKSPTGKVGRASCFEQGNLELREGSVQQFAEAVSFTAKLDGTYTHATLELSMNSWGDWHFSGHVHNTAVTGCAVWISAGPNFVDANGKTIVMAADRSLGGELDFEDRSDDWDQSGNDPFITTNWQFIRSAGIKSGMHSKTMPGDFLGFLWPALVPFAVVLAFAATGTKPCGPYGSYYTDANGQQQPRITFKVIPKDQPCPDQPWDPDGGF
jgi:hypothetical protein